MIRPPRICVQRRVTPAVTPGMTDQPLNQRLREIRDAQHEPVERVDEPTPEPPPELPHKALIGRLLVDKGLISEAVLDPADHAFELIDDRDPEQLEIVRARGGELEHVWSYRRADGAAPAVYPS